MRTTLTIAALAASILGLPAAASAAGEHGMTVRRLVGPVVVAGKPYSPRMSCAQASGIVASQGAAVVATGPHTYDRYVLHQGFCSPQEFTKAAFVPTADRPACLIGYVCQPYSNEMQGGR